MQSRAVPAAPIVTSAKDRANVRRDDLQESEVLSGCLRAREQQRPLMPHPRKGNLDEARARVERTCVGKGRQV